MRSRPWLPVLMAVCLVAGLAVMSTPGAAAPAGAATGEAVPPEARDLIEKHVRWLGGWAALDAMCDMTLEGRLQVAGLSGSLTVRQRRDGHALTEYDLGVLKGRECLAGDAGWEINASGQLEAMGQAKAREQAHNLARSFNRHLRGEGVAVSVGGREEKGGRAWTVLRFAYPEGDAYELLVDPETGESLWARGIVDGRTTWSGSSDLRVVDGVRFAFRQETTGENPLENQVVVWDRVALNTGLADSLFARPGEAVRLARLPAGVTTSSWLPMDLYMGRYIYLHGALNGADTDILLDSGAGMTVLEAATAKAAGLQASGALAAQGVGGYAQAGLVEGVTLRLGEVEIGPLTAAVLDLSELTARMGRSMPVILGKELFHAFVVDIDYPNSRLRVHEPESFRYEGPGHRLALAPAQDGHKDVTLTVEKLAPAVFGLDTGQGGEITLFRPYTEAHKLLEGRRLSERKGGGVGGVVTNQVGTLRTLEIAGYQLRDVPASFDASTRTAFDTSERAGNLGTGILKRFRVLFDYAHDGLWLEPGPGLEAPFDRDKTGLSLVPDGDALKVFYVSPGSPAAAAGWREGERVSALDGEPYSPQWGRTWLRWQALPDGATVMLTMADGSARTLTLQTYY